MSLEPEKQRWVWVVVQNAGGLEQFLGQSDQDQDVSFIPVFLQKDAALQGLARLACEKGIKYEVQAIQLEDLGARARQNGFRVFILDEEGHIVERM